MAVAIHKLIHPPLRLQLTPYFHLYRPNPAQASTRLSWVQVGKADSLRSLLEGEDPTLNLFAVGQQVEFVIATVEKPSEGVWLNNNGLILGEQCFDTRKHSTPDACKSELRDHMDENVRQKARSPFYYVVEGNAFSTLGNWPAKHPMTGIMPFSTDIRIVHGELLTNEEASLTTALQDWPPRDNQEERIVSRPGPHAVETTQSRSSCCNCCNIC